MSPGDVRTFKRGEGNAVVVGHGLWAVRQGKWIHIHITGPDNSHTTVTNNPESVRFHRTLFRDLRRTLINQSCWSYGEDGAEAIESDVSLTTQVTVQSPAVTRFQPVHLRGDGPTASELLLRDRERS